jgi:oligo-1,6-glucosidase
MNKRQWWKESIVYQIYPRSFKDTNGDGIGDLEGIIGKLDYLKDLGVDVIWLSPIYESPNDDNGYDISDYRKIASQFGTMETFDALLAESHERNLKIVMDLVVNHTSDEHKWFVESRKSKDNPYRDYYIWKDNETGNPPNNWKSYFSGSAWELDPVTDSWYLHCFTKKQCDLNWDNPKVREEVWDLMRYWGDKGIDGFRMDAFTLISKGSFDDLPAPHGEKLVPVEDAVVTGPNIHEYLREMHRKVISRYDWMTVGEASGIKLEDARDYVDFDRDELNMIFQFDHVKLGYGERGGRWNRAPLDLVALKKIFADWTAELDEKGWNALYWGNHDQPRSVSSFGNDSEQYRVPSAKMLALCLLFMKGTPFIYQGEELGMTNNRNFTELSQFDDVETRNAYKDLLELGFSEEQALAMLQRQSRDNARTPMQWDDSENAGFTDPGTRPWIEMNPNYPRINVKSQMADPGSVYHFYKKLIGLRHEHDVAVYGDFKMLDPENKDLFVYERVANDLCDDRNDILVVCNFFDREVPFEIPAAYRRKGCSVCVANMEHKEGVVQPYEAFAIMRHR